VLPAKETSWALSAIAGFLRQAARPNRVKSEEVGPATWSLDLFFLASGRNVMFLLGMVSGGPVERVCKNLRGVRRGVRLPDSERFARAAETGAIAMFYTEAKRIKTRGEEKCVRGSVTHL
jgi:hypothetical protein